MLKPLIWGSQNPGWEDDEAGRPASQQASQRSATAAAAAAARGFKREPSQDRRHQHPAATSPSAAAPCPRPRGNYDPARGGTALLGPLSVNDPQLEPRDRGHRFVLSESFLNIASPFGPFGAGNEWRVLQKDAPEHVHRLLRALAVAQDYAGAARALATLHRLHSAFDPDVYRFTVALLRLSGNHQKTSMYFRKILGKRARSIKRRRVLQGRAIAHDFLAYLANKHKFDEALNISQNFLQGGSLSNNGAFKHDPSLQAHGAVLQLFAALLEHQASARETPSAGSDTATTRTTGSTAAAAAAAADGDGRRRRHSPPPPRLVPDLQDPLSMIGHVRACWSECAGAAQADSPQGRAWEHLKRAKRLLGQAATGLPGDASVAGYRAAVTAAESGTVAALRQLEHFVERNPGSVKGRALHTRLLEMSFREARRGVAAAAAAAATGGGGNGGGHETSGINRRPEAGDSYGGGRQGNQTRRDGEQEDAAKADHNNSNNDDRLLLVGVARARALRRWLETDPLEPRASLGLASLHSEGSGAVVGVADQTFVVDNLVRQLEMSCGLPRSCPSASRGVLYTTRAATALWAALADLLAPLRVRDEPVPVVRRGGGGGGLKRPRSTTTAATAAAGAPPPPPPRPGTIWDHLYGADPPWAPTDFARLEQGGGFNPGGGGGGGGCGYIDGVGGVLEETEGAGELAGSELPGLGSSPHPLLRGVDRELWGETVLDPGGEPLLLAKTTRAAAGRGGEAAAEEEEAETWCSDDEDCASGDESELLQERARLASRRTGGCLYYCRPPGGEEGLRTRATGQEKKRPFFEATTAGIVLEGMADVVEERGDGYGEDGRGEPTAAVSAGLGETTEVEEEEQEGDRRTGSARERRRHGHPRRGRTPREGEEKQGAAAARDEGGSSEDGGSSSRANKRRRRRGQWDGVKKERAFGGAAGGGSSSGGGGGSSRRRNQRRDIDSEDDADADSDADAEVELIGSVTSTAKKSQVIDPDYSGGDDEDDDSADEWDDKDDDGDGEDGVGAPALREPEAVLGRPVGTDAAATRLSETVSVALPQQAAVWLLADKCLVAAHMFGPQHRYCLRAIGRLCREDLREAARPARAALRSRGFRLQLSLTRLAAASARSKAAKEERKPSVAWGLPEPPSAVRKPLPFDSYVPEPFQPWRPA